LQKQKNSYRTINMLQEYYWLKMLGE